MNDTEQQPDEEGESSDETAYDKVQCENAD